MIRDLIDMIRDLIDAAAVMAGMFFVFCVVVIPPLIALDMWQCAAYDTATKKATKYSAGVCYIQDGGEWYSWTEYKHRLVTKGEMK